MENQVFQNSKVELRDTQIEDINKLLKTNYNLFVTNQQRTGKTYTIQFYFLLEGYEFGLFLLPKTPILDFQESFIKAGVPEERIVNLTTYPPDERYAVLTTAFENNKVVLCSHGMWQTLVNNNVGMAMRMLISIIVRKKSLFVVDEVHQIGLDNLYKNARKSKGVSKAMSVNNMVKNFTRTIFMTGTPLKDNIHQYIDYAFHLKLLDPDMKKSEIYDYYFNRTCDSWGRDVIGSVKNLDEYMQFVNKFTITRTTVDTLDFIEEPKLNTVVLKMPDAHIKDLENIKSSYLLPLEGIERFITTTLHMTTIQKQFGVSPRILGFNYKSIKEQYLEELLKNNPDKSIVMFCNSKKFINLFSEEHNIEYITGGVSAKKRHIIIEDFQNNRIKQLLINTSAGNAGISLDNADIIIFIDLPYKLNDLKQAMFRGVAQTKDRVKSQSIISLYVEETDTHVTDNINQKYINVAQGDVIEGIK